MSLSPSGNSSLSLVEMTAQDAVLAEAEKAVETLMSDGNVSDAGDAAIILGMAKQLAQKSTQPQFCVSALGRVIDDMAKVKGAAEDQCTCFMQTPDSRRSVPHCMLRQGVQDVPAAAVMMRPDQMVSKRGFGVG